MCLPRLPSMVQPSSKPVEGKLNRSSQRRVSLSWLSRHCDGTVGTENVSSGICCDERCGSKCGGKGCFFGGGAAAGMGPDFCCLKQITESEVYCDGGNQAAPCIIGEQGEWGAGGCISWSCW